MYSFFSKISAVLSEPFANAANTDIAFLAALFLGFIGSVAPCQMSANVAAIAYFGNRQAKEKLSWIETSMYLLGKIIVFSLFGALFWYFGQQIATESIPLYAFARKLLGPIMIVMGLVLIGWLRLPFQFGAKLSQLADRMVEKSRGKASAFVMGAAFSLGFCPTMFVLFFGSLMPLAIQSPYGVILPSIFAVGTAMPFLLFAGIAVGFGLDKVIVKRAKRWGVWVQRFAGAFFIVLGIGDTLMYWI
jgi:cytochrome c-type biogenesis protein